MVILLFGAVTLKAELPPDGVLCEVGRTPSTRLQKEELNTLTFIPELNATVLFKNEVCHIENANQELVNRCAKVSFKRTETNQPYLDCTGVSIPIDGGYISEVETHTVDSIAKVNPTRIFPIGATMTEQVSEAYSRLRYRYLEGAKEIGLGNPVPKIRTQVANLQTWVQQWISAMGPQNATAKTPETSETSEVIE